MSGMTTAFMRTFCVLVLVGGCHAAGEDGSVVEMPDESYGGCSDVYDADAVYVWGYAWDLGPDGYAELRNLAQPGDVCVFHTGAVLNAVGGSSGVPLVPWTSQIRGVDGALVTVRDGIRRMYSDPVALDGAGEDVVHDDVLLTTEWGGASRPTDLVHWTPTGETYVYEAGIFDLLGNLHWHVFDAAGPEIRVGFGGEVLSFGRSDGANVALHPSSELYGAAQDAPIAGHVLDIRAIDGGFVAAVLDDEQGSDQLRYSRWDLQSGSTWLRKGEFGFPPLDWPQSFTDGEPVLGHMLDGAAQLVRAQVRGEKIVFERADASVVTELASFPFVERAGISEPLGEQQRAFVALVSGHDAVWLER